MTAFSISEQTENSHRVETLMTLRVFQTSEQQLYIKCSSGIYLFIFLTSAIFHIDAAGRGCIIRNVSPTFVQCFLSFIQISAGFK